MNEGNIGCRPVASVVRQLLEQLGAYKLDLTKYGNVKSASLNSCPFCSKYDEIVRPAEGHIPFCKVDAQSGRIQCNSGCIALARPFLPPEEWAPSVTKFTAEQIVASTLVNGVINEVPHDLTPLGGEFQLRVVLPGGLPPVTLWCKASKDGLASVFFGVGLNLPPAIYLDGQQHIDPTVLMGRTCVLRVAHFSGWKRQIDAVEIVRPDQVQRINQVLEHERIYGQGKWLAKLIEEVSGRESDAKRR